MAIFHQFLKLALLSILVLALCTPTFAITVQSPTCEIQGDPDVYGIGIRCGLYLQWASLIIVLSFCPEEADVQRTASTITTLAVYINMFRGMRHGSLVVIDYPLVWYFTAGLTLFNWSVGKRNGASQVMMLFSWAMYYLAGPWVAFNALQIGRQPGCDVKYVIFVPISVYSKGLVIYMKFAGVSGVILVLFLLVVIGPCCYLDWTYTEDAGAEGELGPTARCISRILALLQLMLGAFTIVFAERTLTSNGITFPDTHIFDSGQLIPLLIGIFTFGVAVFRVICPRENRRILQNDVALAYV